MNVGPRVRNLDMHGHWDTQMADSERYGMRMVMWLSSGSLRGRSMLLVYHRCLGVGSVSAWSWMESDEADFFAEVGNFKTGVAAALELSRYRIWGVIDRCTLRGKGSRSGALDGKCATLCDLLLYSLPIQLLTGRC